MKILNLLTGFALLLVLASCGGNEDALNTEVAILGTWQVEELTYSAETSASFSFDEESTPVITEVVLEAQAEDSNLEIVFNEDTYSSSGSYNIVGKMVVSENQFGTEQEQAINQNFELNSSIGTYTLADNKITTDKGFVSAEVNGQDFMDESKPSEMEIIKLTETELILKIAEQWSEEELIAEAKFTSSYQITGEIKLKRK